MERDEPRGGQGCALAIMIGVVFWAAVYVVYRVVTA